MEAFYNIITDKEEITDGISSNQQTKFYNEKIQELWEYIDKKILSHANYKILENRDYYGSSTILTSDEFSSDRKFQFKSIEYNKKSITFYQSKECCSKASLNRPYFEVGYNNDGSIYYAYQTSLSQKRDSHRDEDGKGVIIKYTPQDSTLTITSQFHFPQTSLRFARWEEEDATTYNIANENSISTLNQLIRLYENNATLAEVTDNINEIVNATYLTQAEEESKTSASETKESQVSDIEETIEETGEDKASLIEETTTEEEIIEETEVVSKANEEVIDTLKEVIKSTVYPQDQKVETEEVEKIISQLDFKSDLLKEISPVAIETTLSNSEWFMSYENDCFLGYDSNGNSFIHLCSNDHSEELYIRTIFDDSTITFNYSESSEYGDGCSLSREYFTTTNNDVLPHAYLCYDLKHNIASIYTGTDIKVMKVSIPEERKEDFICQIASNYINRATSEEIIDHALSFEQQDNKDGKVLEKQKR